MLARKFPVRFRVPRVYLSLAFLAISANLSVCRINKLPIINRHRRFESLPLRQIPVTPSGAEVCKHFAPYHFYLA